MTPCFLACCSADAFEDLFNDVANARLFDGRIIKRPKTKQTLPHGCGKTRTSTPQFLFGGRGNTSWRFLMSRAWALAHRRCWLPTTQTHFNTLACARM